MSACGHKTCSFISLVTSLIVTISRSDVVPHVSHSIVLKNAIAILIHDTKIVLSLAFLVQQLVDTTSQLLCSLEERLRHCRT